MTGGVFGDEPGDPIQGPGKGEEYRVETITDMRVFSPQLVTELAPGKTFADVGGLWQTVNEMVSVAARAGAREATMIDIQKPESRLWAAFHEHCASLDVAGYRSIVGDICDDGLHEHTGSFDITYCSGVLYHCPNPLNVIRNLLAMTRESLVLSSATLPERIINGEGVLELPLGQCLLVPTLDAPQLSVLREYFIGQRRTTNAVGITKPLLDLFRSDGQLRTGPWWWLFTAETLVRMCELFDAEVVGQWRHRPGLKMGTIGGTVLMTKRGSRL